MFTSNPVEKYSKCDICKNGQTKTPENQFGAIQPKTATKRCQQSYPSGKSFQQRDCEGLKILERQRFRLNRSV
jgi:hypothetical protein